MNTAVKHAISTPLGKMRNPSRGTITKTYLYDFDPLNHTFI